MAGIGDFLRGVLGGASTASAKPSTPLMSINAAESDWEIRVGKEVKITKRWSVDGLLRDNAKMTLEIDVHCIDGDPEVEAVIFISMTPDVFGDSFIPMPVLLLSYASSMGPPLMIQASASRREDGSVTFSMTFSDTQDVFKMLLAKETLRMIVIGRETKPVLALMSLPNALGSLASSAERARELKAR